MLKMQRTRVMLELQPMPGSMGSITKGFSITMARAQNGGAAVLPPGGFQSAGHRRCANGVPNSFQTGSVQSQLANLDILSSNSFAHFDLKCSYPYPFLSPAAWGSPEPSSKKLLSAACWPILVDFLPFRTTLEK